MQSELRNCEWDEFTAHWDHGPSPVKYVYRRVAGQTQFEPWVVVARSALLARLNINGLGLYAARSFRRGDYIGKYDGSVVGHFGSREAAMASPQARRLLRRQHDAVEHDEQDLTQDRRPHRSRRSIVRRHHRHSRALHVFPVDPEVALLAIESLFAGELLRLASHVRQLIQLRRRLVVHIGESSSRDDGREVCMVGEREGEGECS